MAWCIHCVEDRPIQRQTFESRCAFCNQVHEGNHHSDCRGPVAGALDVCTFCNTPVFAKAANETRYNDLKSKEDAISNSDWGLLMRHGATNVSEEDAKAIVDLVRAKQGVQAMQKLHGINPTYPVKEASYNAVVSLGRELGVVKSGGGCMAMLLVPLLLVAKHFLT